MVISTCIHTYRIYNSLLNGVTLIIEMVSRGKNKKEKKGGGADGKCLFDIIYLFEYGC